MFGLGKTSSKDWCAFAVKESAVEIQILEASIQKRALTVLEFLVNNYAFITYFCLNKKNMKAYSQTEYRPTYRQVTSLEGETHSGLFHTSD